MRKSIERKIKEKEDKNKFITQVTVMKKLISMYAENSVKSIIMLKLKDLLKEIPTLSFDQIAFLSTIVPQKISKDEELLMKLASSFSLEGVDKDIQFSDEEFESFVIALYNLLTADYIKDVLKDYDIKKFQFDKILEGSKIVTGVEMGEEYEIVN